MVRLIRTGSENRDFIELVRLLDAELAIRDGDAHSFYSQFNKIDNIKYVVLAYDNGKPAGCGSIKEFSANAVEIKRMYVSSTSRNRGIATKILNELEKWAGELLYAKTVLETGKGQPEAIALYQKKGYKLIPNYGQYAGVDNSLCFEKELDILKI
jgi:GNAT superfamily N-acetyltransferase